MKEDVTGRGRNEEVKENQIKKKKNLLAVLQMGCQNGGHGDN